MRILARIVDAFVIGFAAWTVSYHLVFFSRLPAGAVYGVWPLLLGLAWLFFRRPCAKINWRESWIEALPSLLTGVGLAVWSAFIYIPFEDNYSFLHRAFWQMGHLREPFAVHFTSLTALDLPPLSESHLMTSIEMLGAFGARAVHTDALWVSFTGIPALTAFITACAVGLLGRLLGLRRLGVILLLAGFVAGSLLSNDVLRSVALFGLPRLSEGKCAMVFTGIPLAYLYILRFAKQPSRRHWALLACVAMCFVGWTGSGILLAPVIFLFAAIALFARRWKVGGLLLMSGIYPVACYILAKASFIPAVKDTSVWIHDWPGDWYQNILLVSNGPLNLAVRLTILSLGVVLACRRQDRWLMAIPLLGVLLLFNPLLGPAVIKVVPPGVFWRLGYLGAFPLGLGLCFAAGANWEQIRGKAGIMMSLAVVALGAPLAIPGHLWVVAGSPVEPKWFPRELTAARAARGQLQSQRLLAPERVACILALLDPSLKFDSIRSLETRHFYRNAARGAEGEACASAEEFLQGKASDASGLKARLATGLRQVIVEDARLGPVTQAIRDGGYRAEVNSLSPGYKMLRVVRR